MGNAQQSIEGRLLLDDIAERGYAEFNHVISADQIEHLVDAYAQFTLAHPNPSPETMSAMLLQEPDGAARANTKYQDRNGIFVPGKWMAAQLDELDYTADKQAQWHKYRTNTPQVGKPDGYTNRSFQQGALRDARGLILDPPEDPKEYYHFTPSHQANMARAHQKFGWGSIPGEVTSLEQAFTPVHAKAVELVVRICAIIEETHPEIRNFVSLDALRTSPVRLLFYHPEEARPDTDVDYFGAGHYDKSALTLQLAESHEGLRVAPHDGALMEPVRRNSDKAAFFPGKALSTQYENSPYSPGWHDIVKTDVLNQGRSVPAEASAVCARWAIIFFANYANYVQPSKASMHTR